MSSSNITHLSDGVFTAFAKYSVFDSNLKKLLLNECLTSQKKRARINFHSGPDDPVQEMIICMSRESDVPIHNHLDKSESFCVLDGSLGIVLFEENTSTILDVIYLSSLACKALPLFYRLNSSIHHLVIPLTDYVFFHEVTTGPFPGYASPLPIWTQQADALQMLSRIKKHVTKTYNSF